MARLVKILSYYPIVLISGILLFVARVFGWGCLVAFLLFGGFKLAGELDVNGLSVATVLGVGVLTLVLADGCAALLIKLDAVVGEK